MAILIADSFQYQGRKPLDSRIVIETIADMIAIAESIIYEGIIVYNKETKKYYTFDPTRTPDPNLGKWEELKIGGTSNNTLIETYDQNTPYKQKSLITYDNKLYFVIVDFTSDSTEATAGESLQADINAGNLIAISTENDGPCLKEYQQKTDYVKDTLVYCGDRIGRVAVDFTSDSSKLPIQDSFALDVAAGNIIVDKIDIKELDEQLLKALPIVAFVTKHAIPRFESNIVISGSIPTFRDGTSLSTEEKIGCSFLYIVDANDELTGLAIVINYDETTDEFTVNAMKYGVGTADSIIKTSNTLTETKVGSTQIVAKDTLLSPVLTISATEPENNNLIWYESTALDSANLVPSTVNVKKYNNNNNNWELDTIDLNNGDVIRNNNGSEWEYYKIYSSGNVSIALSKFQIIYDTNTILGKITDIDRVNRSITVETIHSNANTESSLQENIQANTAIGAAQANTLYPEGMTFTEFLKKIAIKEILAAINFSVTNAAGLKKKGTTIPAPTLTTTFTNLGNVPIESIDFYVGNTKLDTQNYIGGIMTYNYDYSSDITDNLTFVTIINQEGNKTVRKESKFVFVNPRYIGVVNTLTPTVDDITALTEDLSENRARDYTISMNDARICYAYPSSMGNLTSIKDSNNFEYLNSFTKTNISMNDDTYNIYTLTDPVSITNFKWSFK